MSGLLTIHSTGSGEWLFGHSWIEFISDKTGEVQTFGTWGNNPTGEGNGLFRNLELGQRSDESRTYRIDDLQEAVLFAKLEFYRDLGSQAWSLLSPCSSFAEDVWASTTGERLAHQSVLISTPAKLKESIAEANRRDAPRERPLPGPPAASPPGAPTPGPCGGDQETGPERKKSKLRSKPR